MWPVPCRRAEARLHGRACTMLVNTPSPRCQPAANSQKVSASTRTRVMGIWHVGRGAGCRGSRRRGDTRGGTDKHPREATWTPDAKTCSGVQEIPSPEGVVLFLTSAPLRRWGAAALHGGHATAQDKACDERNTHRMAPIRMPEERDPRVSLGKGSPTQQAFCENYACCAISLLHVCSTRCYTRSCCWARNALPRLLAICHGCSGGSLLVSRKPDSRPPLCFFGLPFPCGRDAYCR